MVAKHLGKRCRSPRRWSPGGTVRHPSSTPDIRPSLQASGIPGRLALVIDGELGLLLGFGVLTVRTRPFAAAPGIRITSHHIPTVAFNMRLGYSQTAKFGFHRVRSARIPLLIASMGSKVAGHCSYDVSINRCSCAQYGYRLDALATGLRRMSEMTSQVSETMTTRAVSHRWTRVQDWTGSSLQDLFHRVWVWVCGLWIHGRPLTTTLQHVLLRVPCTAIPDDQGRSMKLSFDDTKPGASICVDVEDISLAPCASPSSENLVSGARPTSCGATSYVRCTRVSIGTMRGQMLRLPLSVSDFEGTRLLLEQPGFN